MSLALVSSRTDGPRLATLLQRIGWDTELVTGNVWRALGSRSIDLVLAQLPWTGWRDFVRDGRRAVRQHPGTRLVFVTEVLPPGLGGQALDGYPATPLVRLSSSPSVLKSSIDAAS